MKVKLYFCLFVGIGLAYCFFPKNKTKDSRNTVLLNRVVKQVQERHFVEIPIDDNFSELMFKQFIKKLDPDKIFFTQVDIQNLHEHQHSIDEEITNGTFKFFNQATKLLNENIIKVEAYCQNEIDHDIDIYSNEVFNLKNKKSEYAKDDMELQNYWRKKIKHKLIHQLSLIEKGATKISIENQKKKALSKVEKYYQNKFKKYKSIDEQKHFQQYLQAFLNLHDAQSAYMTPQEKEEWDLRIGRSLTGIGVNLNIINEYPQITKITTGGPAWKTGKVNVGDVILKISHTDGTFVDTWGMQIKEFLSYLKGAKGSPVNLQLQKTNGEIELVEIIRDELKMELAMSFILNSADDDRRIGYLMLPRFYSGGEDAAYDVSQELELLKANKVDGIIFDVRNNRGGYSNIAIDIMGYFLEEGVVMQTQARNQKRRLLKDDDAYVSFKGDLVVLVDSYSASASELFAGTMQDYNRGVIVGSKATFGKGSMQHFFDLDAEADGEFLELGSLKLTTSRFYTGCGNTPQTTGIIPDIQIPDDETYITSGERRYDNSIPTELSEKTICTQTVNNVENMEALKENSAKRIAKNKRFQIAEKKALAIKEEQESTTIPLNYDAFKRYQANRFKPEEFDHKIFTKIPDFQVSVAPQEIVGRDSVAVSRDTRWINKLERDPYVQECYWIMLDCLDS